MNRKFSTGMNAGLRRAAAPWMVCFVVAAGLFARAQFMDDSNATDFSSFQVIVQRNIFDPNRYPHNPGYRPESRGAPTFSLAGTMSYRKGMFAFFSGTSSDYQKALQEGGTIAGYTVGKITFDGVQLQNAGKQVDMKVGAAMRQEGGGWELNQPGAWDAGASADSGNQGTNATSPAGLPSSSEPNDVLKRLMERREQEEQQK